MWLLHYITNRSLETPAAVKGVLSTGEAGGASIVLKNNGSVLINGREVGND